MGLKPISENDDTRKVSKYHWPSIKEAVDDQDFSRDKGACANATECCLFTLL